MNFIVGVLSIGFGVWLVWDSYLFYSCRLQSKAHIYLIEGSFPAYGAVLYGAGPMGIGIAFVGIVMTFPLSSDIATFILTYITGPLCVIGFGLVLWQPYRLTPSWLIWFEEYNYDIRSLLGEEARQTPNWTQRIKSQADLKAWVAEVREKHYEPQPIESYTEALKRAGITPPSKLPWIIAILGVPVGSIVTHFLLDNLFIGFVGGWIILGLIWLFYYLRGN